MIRPTRPIPHITHGTLWRRPTARALGRDPKMIRRFVTGDSIVAE
jgi:hypothetical protein